MKSVTFNKNGIPSISYYDDYQSNEEIIKLLHQGDVRQQMVEYFRKLNGKCASYSTMGYALENISKKRFCSRISNIQFHSPNQRFNIKFNKLRFKELKTN